MGQRYVRVFALVLGASCLFLLLFLGLSSPAVASAAGACNAPVAGRHVYDCAGLLSESEVTAIEAQAAAVARAGAPTVVYLQVREATYADTYQEAAALMSRFDVESRPGAKDGFVMYLNLLPGSLHHGQVVLYAGASQAAGPLSASTLARIYADQMLPLLKSEQTAQGILAGLRAVAAALFAHPALPADTGTGPGISSDFLRLPANIGAGLVCALVVLLSLKIRPPRPRVRRADQRTTPPGTLTPDLVGALVRGRICAESIQAMILSLACHGVLAVESNGNGQVFLRLLPHKQKLSGIQDQLWALLARAADAQRRVRAADLEELDEHWLHLAASIRKDLLRRHWYDPEAGFRRIWLRLSGALLLFLGGLEIVGTLVTQEPWGLLGSSLLLGVGGWACWWAARMPHTTAQGEKVAVQWRGYLAGLKALPATSMDSAQLDTALPYLLAMGADHLASHRLRLAEAHGYQPTWLHESHKIRPETRTCAPAWSAFRHHFQPSLVLDRSNAVVIGWRGGFIGGRGGGAGGGGGGAGGAGAGGAGAGGAF